MSGMWSHAKGSQEALCTAPATRSQPRPSGADARRSSSRRLCVLRLPRERQPGSSAHGTPRPSGAHARRSSSNRLCVLRLPRERQPGSSLYCACHTKPAAAQRRPRAPQLVQEALCTAPATRKAARKLSVLRLRPSSTHARRSSCRRLCILHLPRERQPGSSESVYCACHAKPAAAQRRPRAAQLLQEALCTAPATRKAARKLCAWYAAAQRRPRAPQLLQQALCTAPATRKAARKLSVLRLPHEASRGPAAPTRAAARPGGSVYCACHAKGSRGPSAATRTAARRGGSVYCACHAKGSRGPSGGHARRSSSRRLCVLRLPRERQPRPQRRPRAPQLVQEALCSASATQKASSLYCA